TRPQPEANVREPKAELEAKVGELTKESMKRCQQLFFDARMGTGMQPQPRYFDVLCQLLSGNDEARCSLDSYLDQHLFPATTRLLALRGRAELELDRASPDMVKLLALLRDAVELAEQLQAPMHVGYAQLGITLTELWVKVEDKNVNDRKWLQTSALRYLRQSVEMVTQGNAYYEAIGPLYSPYDDFNDRRRHLQHALQMAGYDLCLHCIKRLENHANDTPQPTGTC
ncbi:MAG TPA: hypothetical protein PLA94_23035, partial [Myxococcota bacterium]|nr:hypothetical protein [Myxococcota bacterium]